MLIRLLAVSGIGFLALGSLYGQTAGRVDGTVVDPTGALVANAKISLFLHDGASALLTAETTSDGVFSIGTVRPDLYDLTVEAAGFARAKVENVQVDAAAETSLPPVRLEVAASSQNVKVVSESAASVNTETIEVDNVISRDQLDDLPTQDRQVTSLLQTQPGVTLAVGATVVNGMRTTATNVTFDGVNIQDNFLRGNSLDITVANPTIDQIQEVTVIGSNANPALGNGAGQVVLITPSGTDTFHGSLYWYNRNADFAANNWFSNQSGVPRAPLNLNQFGGTLGGPIIKDKLFFYFNYDGYQEAISTPVNNLVLTASARQGLLTYPTITGGTGQINVLTASGLSTDPAMTAILNQMPLPNNTQRTGSDGLNLGGYRINEPDNQNRNQISGKLDYYLSSKSVFSGSYNFNTDNTPDAQGLQGYFGGPVDVVVNEKAKLLSSSWRWTPTPRLTNELRGGFALSAIPFNITGKAPTYYLSALTSLPGPQPGGLPQGRTSKVFSLQDNAMYARGRHNFSFGVQSHVVHEHPYDYLASIPIYLLLNGPASPFQFTPSNMPGAQAGYTNLASDLLGELAGLVGIDEQQFSVTSPTSGYVPGAPAANDLIYNTYSGYFADNYKVARGFTLNLGVRYDYWTPVYESHDLFFSPALENNNPYQTIEDPNAVLNFTGSPSHPAYQVRKTNFSPNVGFAWDVFGDGKTSVRGGYSLGFFNDDAMVSVASAAVTNGGTTATVENLTNTLLRNGPPAITTPTFTSPTPISAVNSLSTPFGNAETIINPNLKTPYYEQYNIGIERRVGQTLFDVRYVGNHGADLLQSINQNQVDINAGGFLQDFVNAQNNGLAAVAAGLNFNPAYNASVPGSKPLPVFGELKNGGLLGNTTVVNDIETGQVASLAEFYQTNRDNGSINFFRNPNELYGRVLTNYANSTYNSLQTEARGKLTKDLQFQFSYVFSKVLTDAAGFPGLNAEQGNINDLLDVNNGKIERGRAPFDITHVFKANYIYRVPLGQGHLFLSRGLADRILGGWTTSAIILRQSGNPFGILDQIGTFNWEATWQTALVKGTTKSQLDSLVGSRTWVNGNGVYLVNPSILSSKLSSAYGAAPFGTLSYNGQIFFNPGPGQVGNLQPFEFTGPWVMNMNASAQKTVRLFERHTLQLRFDFYNLFNHPSFAANSPSVETQGFGRAATTVVGPRVIQFGVHYRF